MVNGFKLIRDKVGDLVMRVTSIDLRALELARKGMELELAGWICQRIDALTTGQGLEEFYEGEELEQLKSSEEARQRELKICENTRNNFTPM